MKIRIITGLLLSTALLTTAGAMEVAPSAGTMMKDKMTDDHMMAPTSSMMKKDDAMMTKDTMKSGDTMMKSMMPTSDTGMGARGEHVTSLQKFLIEKGFLTLPSGTAHGYYGSMTKKAVMAYQESVGINPTGFFGPKTRMAMQDKMMDDGKMIKRDNGMMKDKMVQ